MIFKRLHREIFSCFMYLKSNIAFLTKKNRLKDREFGEIIKVSTPVAGSYIRGISTPKYETLITISNHFNVSCDDLLKKELSKEKNLSIGLIGEHIVKDVEIPATKIEENVLDIVKNEEEYMKIKAFSNIIDVRVAKEILKITTNKETLLKYINS